MTSSSIWAVVVVKAGSAAGHIKNLKKTDPQNKALWQELSGDQSVNRRSDSAFLLWICTRHRWEYE